MNQESDFGKKVALLRERFDQTFALPPPVPVAGRVRLLGIGVADSPYALRLADLASLTLNRKVVPLPGGIPQLRGLMGLRGRLVAVYSLGALLDSAGKGAPEPWVAQCGTDPSIGLSFAEFSGHLEMDPDRFQRSSGAEAPKGLVKEFVQHGSIVRAVIDVPSVLAAIQGLGRRGTKS